MPARAPPCRARGEAAHVLAETTLLEWQAQALDEHRVLAASGRFDAALACSASAIERLHAQLGAPPAIDAWVELLDTDRARCDPEDPHVEATILRGALGILARRPRHPALPLWHARALAALRDAAPAADEAIIAAHFAFEYAVRSGNFALAQEIVDRVRERTPAASAAMRRGWLEADALAAWLAGDHARAQRAVREAIAAGAGYGAWEQGASAAISEGDLREADRCLSAMAARIDPHRTQDVAHMHFLNGARCRIGGDDAGAARHLDACLAEDRTNVPVYFLTLWQLGHAQLLIAGGHWRAAASVLAIVLGRASSHYWSFLRFSALLSRTWLRLREGRVAEASEDLRVALSLAVIGRFRNCDPWWDGEAIAEIVRFAQTVPHDATTLGAFAARKG
jgi:tetratricopeptide (TPR) repeat protein